MGEQEPKLGRSSLEQLLWDHYDALWHFRKNLEKTKKFMAAVDAIEEINDELAKGTQLLLAKSNSFAPTTVYTRDEKGNYLVRNTVFTEGKQFTFLADGLEIIEDTLVAIDSKLGGGISTSGPLRVMSHEDIEKWNEDENYDHFLGMIADTDPGEDAHFDCLYF